jgi:endonuclease/exonuclease/phosphatase family metal-dependent hydrolase
MVKKLGNRKLGVMSRILVILNIIFAICLLMSYFSLFISPERNWLLPFFGLLYPYFLFINLLFTVFWIFRQRLMFILSLVIVGLGWQIILRSLQIRGTSEPHSQEKVFLVTSYNVRNMSNNNMLVQDFRIRDAIVSKLSENKQDILCLQEFEAFGPEPQGFIDSMSRVLEMPYVQLAKYNENNVKRLDAIITFSKFPILSTYQVKKDDRHNYCLINDLLIGKDTVRLFNIHLESVRLRHEDYTFIDDLDLQFKEDENLKEGSRRIFNKLKSAYARRAFQVKNLRNYLADSPYPVIICGDFNDTPCSYSYQVLSKGKRDAFLENGSGFGNTYAGGLPSLRIDYILFDPEFESNDFSVGKYKLSDHYPISATLRRAKGF